MHSKLSNPKSYIALVRGIPGTRRLHRRTLEASRLGKCNQTFVRRNTPTVRCTRPINKNEVTHQAVVALMVVNHLPASASASS
uniref:Large ribosomal subunit protein uL30-like ferredoxin-like fold domain-containing protein n=1 Tax=Salix viminalis TaxID=40686 RepID=A0A6N2N9V2_SALVM